MALTPSTMLPLGIPLPEFELPDAVSGNSVRSGQLQSDLVVVAFICNHCPYVQHIRTGLAEFGRDCAKGGVALIAISSNSVQTHPQDGPAAMAREAQSSGYAFPYLFDESQAVAKAFRAACTPEFYLFGADRRLAYRGQFDASRPGNNLPVTGTDLRAAVDALLAGRSPSDQQTPSVGCNIKWNPGNQPDYFG